MKTLTAASTPAATAVYVIQEKLVANGFVAATFDLQTFDF
jgi:hypothetical protein